jgi:hypothetical protein
MTPIKNLLKSGSKFGMAIFVFLLTYSSLVNAQYYEKITSGALVDIKQRNYSSTWADVNNDGFDDMLILELEVDLQSVLYMNNGDGTFTANPNSGISEHLGPSIAATWADFNNDGFLDVYICNTGNEGDEQSKNMLFKNNGNGTFTRVTSGEIVNDYGWSLGASWADYDRDGFVDLYVANFNGINYLYKNNGDETFTKIITGEIVNESAASYGAYWADVDNDGWPDLFIANAFGASLPPDQNCLFMNNGDGTFTKVLEGHIVNNNGISHGASWGDFNNDGFLDLFVSNHDWSENKFNFLYQNNGDGTFNHVVGINVATDMNTSFGSAWLDANNDGYLDLIVANNKTSNRRNFFYISNGDGTFNSILTDPVNVDVLRSFGMTVSDYNNDGFVDVFVSTYSTSQENGFYKNIGNSNNWLAVALQGTVSNRAAIGAKVNIWAGGIMQTREVNSASGQYSSSSFVQNFGIGTNTIIDSLYVRWPSGIINKLYNINSNQKLNLIEFLPLNDETNIIAFSINDQLGETIIDEQQSSVTVTMPYGQNITALSPVIEISAGATIIPASGESVDFSQGAVNYTVTAENGTDTQVWSAVVMTMPNSETNILTFMIENQVGETIIDLQQSTVAVTMPYGQNLTALSPVIEISAGATIIPASGESVDFSQGAVNYTVTAENGTDTQVWSAIVMTMPNSETNILTFMIENQVGESIIDQQQSIVAVTMQYGQNLTALSPVIEISAGATIIPASGESVDFSQGSVNYTVTAENGTEVKTWIVSVMNLPNTEANMLSFSIENQIGETTINLESLLVEVLMPEGSNLAALTPAITVSDGATVNPASGTITDFSQGSVNYTVTAEDMTTNLVWEVSVTMVTDLNNYKVKNEISISPNPGTGLYLVETMSGIVALKMEVYNSSGQLIQIIDLSNQKENNFTIDISEFPSGMYYVLVKTSSNVIKSKIIKK